MSITMFSKGCFTRRKANRLKLCKKGKHLFAHSGIEDKMEVCVYCGIVKKRR